MAHYEQQVAGDPDAFVAYLDGAITGSSITATREDGSDHRIGGSRMLVRVYERYSASGGNRVSLCVSVLAAEGKMTVSVVTAGGSRAMLLKLNTFGEEAFLQRAVDAIRGYE